MEDINPFAVTFGLQHRSEAADGKMSIRSGRLQEDVFAGAGMVWTHF
jgi:hypothetical protein